MTPSPYPGRRTCDGVDSGYSPYVQSPAAQSPLPIRGFRFRHFLGFRRITLEVPRTVEPVRPLRLRWWAPFALEIRPWGAASRPVLRICPPLLPVAGASTGGDLREPRPAFTRCASSRNASRQAWQNSHKPQVRLSL